MKKYFLTPISFLLFGFVLAQDSEAIQGHKNNNKFKQLYEEFATPNRFRTASGAPGVDYYQQQVDYKMDIELDDANTRLNGQETITYTIIRLTHYRICGCNSIKIFAMKMIWRVPRTLQELQIPSCRIVCRGIFWREVCWWF